LSDSLELTVVVEHLRRKAPGGIGTYARGLLVGLVQLRADGRRDFQVRLYAGAGGRGPDPLAQLDFPLRTSPLGGPLLTRLWDRGLAGPLGRRGVVHSVSPAFPPVRTRLSLMFHDLAFRRVPDTFPERGRRWHEAALRRALDRADLIFTPSQETADELDCLGGVPIEVVEHGADHLPPPDLEGAAGVLEALGVRSSYLLSVGTQEPRKNLARLTQAYARVRPRLPEPWPLVVVGPSGWGGPVPPVEGAVAAGEVSGAVLAGLYARARCLAYVPLLEGFGLPVVEAMVQGCPVVASPMPSTRGAALEVDPLDTEAVAEALVEASGEGPRRQQLIEAGRLRVSGMTWKHSAEKHLAAWRRWS
jgi:glycosyltransferase involved in cell wall biosynthesis